MAEADNALPGGKLFGLLRESRWLLLVACALYFTVALYGYDRADPAWSHSASGALTGKYLDGGRPVGILSIRDIVRIALDDSAPRGA